MFNKYYQDELSFLRELGREFVKTYPEAAPFLGEPGSDPDVERLLEGFAFLSGRVREKIEDELPEITHGLMEMLWPHYLRPIPSVAILQFQALPQAARETRRVPRGTEIASAPVDGTSCRFRTAYDVVLEPVSLFETELRTESPPQLRLRFRLREGLDLKKVRIPSLRLHFHGEPAVTRALHLCLFHRLSRISLRPIEGGAPGKTVELRPDALRPLGFRRDEAIIDTPLASFEGYRLLQEYFTYPSKFLYAELGGLERLAELGEATSFEARFDFRRLPEGMPSLGAAAVLLDTTPITNLFPADADPIRLDPARMEYRIRPAGADMLHHEIHSIRSVTGFVKGTAEEIRFEPFYGFAHSLGEDGRPFYRARVAESVTGEGTDTYITFGDGRGGKRSRLDEIEVVSVELVCTNRLLPSKLRVGDISAPTSSSPVFAKFQNITKPSPSVAPPLGGDVYWRLLSHLSLGYRSLGDLETLRAAIGLHSFRALVDRQAELALKQVLDGIKGVSTEPATRLFRGAPVRGVDVRLDMDEDCFSGEGDMFLLATVLNELFALHVGMNAFSRLSVNGLKHGEAYGWPPRMGERTIA